MIKLDNSKFDVIYEETVMRFQSGGLLEGDFVKVLPSYKNNPKLKGKAGSYFDRLDYVIKSGLPIKVSSIKAERAEVSNGVVGAVDAPTGYWVDIVSEHAPGMWANVVTVPIEILEKIEVGNNFSPGIPDAIVRKDTTDIKGHEVQQADPNRNLPQVNITIKS
jgi:hypothetical protein